MRDLMRLVLSDWPIDRGDLWRDLQMMQRVGCDMTGLPITLKQFDEQLDQLSATGQLSISEGLISPIFVVPKPPPPRAVQQSFFQE